jgi:hypothetical protein
MSIFVCNVFLKKKVATIWILMGTVHDLHSICITLSKRYLQTVHHLTQRASERGASISPSLSVDAEFKCGPPSFSVGLTSYLVSRRPCRRTQTARVSLSKSAMFSLSLTRSIPRPYFTHLLVSASCSLTADRRRNLLLRSTHTCRWWSPHMQLYRSMVCVTSNHHIRYVRTHRSQNLLT